MIHEVEEVAQKEELVHQWQRIYLILIVLQVRVSYIRAALQLAGIQKSVGHNQENSLTSCRKFVVSIFSETKIL